MLEMEVEDANEMNTFIKEEKDLFLTNLIMCIEKGWKDGETHVSIAKFYIKDSGDTVNISIQEDDWYETLHVALYHFEAKEDYEYCSDITQLIIKMYGE